MAICSKCGNELNSGAKFCAACGDNQQSILREEKRTRIIGQDKRPLKNTVIAVTALVVMAAAALAFMFFGRLTGNSSFMSIQARQGNVRKTAASIVNAEKGQIRIPLKMLSGNTASYYVYAVGGKEIRFFVLRASDGSIKAALDACTACYHAKLGYSQQGDTMVCNNCGMSFKSVNVGIVTGGCSPIPVEMKLDNGMIVLQSEEIEAGARYF